MQLNTNEYSAYADLLDMILPQAVDMCVDECIDIRQALPRDVGNFMGVSSVVADADSDSEDETVDGDEEVNHDAIMRKDKEKEHKKILMQQRSQFRRKMTLLLNQVVANTVDLLDVGVDQVW